MCCTFASRLLLSSSSRRSESHLRFPLRKVCVQLQTLHSIGTALFSEEVCAICIATSIACPGTPSNAAPMRRACIMQGHSHPRSLSRDRRANACSLLASCSSLLWSIDVAQWRTSCTLYLPLHDVILNDGQVVLSRQALLLSQAPSAPSCQQQGAHAADCPLSCILSSILGRQRCKAIP